METNHRNKNRGYQQLRVWHGAIDPYVQVCRVFRGFPSELKKVASQEIASADSVHRNTAEGYCRRSAREYFQAVYVALGSLGESVSGLCACRGADQLAAEDFNNRDSLAFKLENGLLRLVQSLDRMQFDGEWVDASSSRKATPHTAET